MFWLIVLCFILLIVLTYLLFAPFYLEVDSTKSLIRIRFHHFASACIVEENSSIKIEMKIAYFKKNFNPFAKIDVKKKKEKTNTDKIHKKRTRVSFNKIMAILKSFKVNRCFFNLDFNDAALNGILYPVFFGMSNFSGKDFRINFYQINEIKLEIENNFARILWAYIKH